MPYVEGESPGERVDREHQLGVGEAVQIAGDVAQPQPRHTPLYVAGSRRRATRASVRPRVSTRSGVYFTRCSPYRGSTLRAVLGKVITGDAPSARAERASVPANVDAAICRALEKVPADRFTNQTRE